MIATQTRQELRPPLLRDATRDDRKIMRLAHNDDLAHDAKITLVGGDYRSKT